MGFLVDKSVIGFGLRSWRYAMIVNDGNIEAIFEEPGYSDECPDDPNAAVDQIQFYSLISGYTN